MVSRGRVPLYAVIAGDVTVHDRGRVASASVVHGRRACGRGAVSVVAVAVAVAVVPWTWPRHGRDRVMAVTAWFLCRRRMVATRRWMLVFAMVYVVSALSWFAI